MKHFWSLWLCPLLLQAAQLPPVPRTEEGLPRGPKPFSSNHYDLLMEYSPFVKSVEAAKETEKSPELVVVGYGRVNGEDYVIIQKKSESGKRAQIGPRFNSKEFPYRLLSVTNKTSRSEFMAVLESAQQQQLRVRYDDVSNSSKSPAPGNEAAVSGRAGSASTGEAQASGQSEAAGFQNLTPVDTVEKLQKQLQNLKKAKDDTTKSEASRESAAKKYEEIMDKLNKIQSPPNDISIEAITPSP